MPQPWKVSIRERPPHMPGREAILMLIVYGIFAASRLAWDALPW